MVWHLPLDLTTAVFIKSVLTGNLALFRFFLLVGICVVFTD